MTGAKILGLGAVLAAVLPAPMTARAGYVGRIEAEFTGVSPAKSVWVSTLRPGGVNVIAGVYHWTKTTPDDGPFWTFCIEPTKWLDSDETVFQVHTLDQILGGAAGDYIVADYVEELWYQKVIVGDLIDPYGSSDTDKRNAAAFQIAVWEFVHEDYSEYGYDLGTGDFRACNSCAVWLAQQWIGNVVDALYDSENPGPSGSTLLYAMTSSETQDQAVLGAEFQVVPLPAAVWGGMMLLGGMGGVAGVRRRLRRG